MYGTIPKTATTMQVCASTADFSKWPSLKDFYFYGWIKIKMQITVKISVSIYELRIGKFEVKFS